MNVMNKKWILYVEKTFMTHFYVEMNFKSKNDS